MPCGSSYSFGWMSVLRPVPRSALSRKHPDDYETSGSCHRTVIILLIVASSTRNESPHDQAASSLHSGRCLATRALVLAAQLIAVFVGCVALSATTVSAIALAECHSPLTESQSESSWVEVADPRAPRPVRLSRRLGEGVSFPSRLARNDPYASVRLRSSRLVDGPLHLARSGQQRSVRLRRLLI